MIKVTRLDKGMNIRLTAGLVEVDETAQTISAFIEDRGFADRLFEVNVLVRESLLNAVTHGSGLDAGREVGLTLELDDGDMTISVEDNGPGWDWKERAITLPPPDQPSGRGLFLIQSYADTFTFNDKGNRLTLRKRLSGKGEKMEQMEISGHQAVITPDQDITAATAVQFKAVIKSAIDQGATSITLDLSEVRMMDSIGVGLLVAVHNTLTKKNGRLTISKACTDIYDLLTVMRLDQHFVIQRA